MARTVVETLRGRSQGLSRRRTSTVAARQDYVLRRARFYLPTKRPQALHGVLQVCLAHDVIPLKYRAGLVPGGLHGDPLRHTGSNEVPHRGSSEVMEGFPLNPRGCAGRPPGASDFPNRLAVAGEHIAHEGLLLSQIGKQGLQLVGQKDRSSFAALGHPDLHRRLCRERAGRDDDAFVCPPHHRPAEIAHLRR